MMGGKRIKGAVDQLIERPDFCKKKWYKLQLHIKKDP